MTSTSESEKPDVKALLEAGCQAELDEKQSAEEDRVGVLRGGNSGCLVALGDGSHGSIGACARRALLRMLGIDVPEDKGEGNSKHLMFAAGISNEDSWVNWLQRSWPGVILRESDVPTRWTTRNGTPVTGRPDIVLARRDEDLKGSEGTTTAPVVGLELKQIASMWTMRDVLADKPKAEHVCQAAHYSMALGVPFELWYASRVYHYILAKHASWIAYQFPRAGARHSDKLQYEMVEAEEPRPRKDGKGMTKGSPAREVPFRSLPFVHGFRLTWQASDEDGTRALHVGPADLGLEAERPTLITDTGIREFYETAAEAVPSGKLPPRPAMLDTFGDEAKYSQCKYCPLQSVCDSYKEGAEPSTAQWLSDVAAHVKEATR